MYFNVLFFILCHIHILWRLCSSVAVAFVAEKIKRHGVPIAYLGVVRVQTFLFHRSWHSVDIFFILLRFILCDSILQIKMVEKLTQTFTNGDHEPNLKIAIVGGGLVI